MIGYIITDFFVHNLFPSARSVQDLEINHVEILYIRYTGRSEYALHYVLFYIGASKKEEKKTRGQKTPVKQVRRNLFTESEEGDENNSTARVPRNRKLSEGEKKEHARRRFHRRNTVGMYTCHN